MRLKHLIACLTLAWLPLSGLAQTAKDIEDWEQKKQQELAMLPKVVQSYASSIGCNVTFDPKNAVHWQGNPKDVSYLALISIDVGCAGGSASWRSLFLAIRQGSYGKLYIYPEHSLPDLTSSKFPQTIDSIVSSEEGVHFSGRVVQGNDPGNNPSRHVTGMVVWSGVDWTPK